jgi:hypothetical protein|nr:MAG TPA: hypothetical protein [Caudoviricetes sp.]
MTTLIEKSILNERLEKSRSGIYADTSENRRKHRVGQKYGSEKKEEEKPEKTDPNKMSPEQQLEAINKVIAAVNEGKLKLPPEEINTLVAKKTMAEEAVKQAKGEKKPEEKEESKKEATKPEAKSEGKQYAPMDIKEAKKELVGKKITFKEYFFDGVDSYKDAEGEIKKVRLYGKEKQPIAEIDFPNGDGITISLEQLDKRKAMQYEIEFNDSKSEEPKQEASGQASEADKDDLREARRKLSYLQDNEERLIKRDGKERYEERLKQAKDEVAELKGEEPQEETKSEPKKEESRGEKKTDKASDPIYQVQQKKKEASKKYDSKREEARQKYDKEADEIRSEIDKLYESDHPDAAKKRKELWNTLKEKTNKYDAETTRLKDEYEAEYKKLDEAEDKLYDQRQKEETSEEVKESYTRVKFEDVPNSGKVNLKKYLSEKVRQGVDEKWSNIKNIPTDNLKKMEKGLVNDLNKNFEAIKKSQRAELLYSIMKVKGELEKRGKESQKKE